MNVELSPAQKRLNSIVHRSELASPTWSMMADGQLHMIAGDENGLSPVLTFAADANVDDREFIGHAPDDLRWLLPRYLDVARRFHEARAEIAKLSGSVKDHAAPTTPKKKRMTVAQTCGKMCGDPEFLRFLAVCENVDTSDRERVANRVRTMLMVASRADLDTDGAARQRWFDLCDRFRAWLKQQGAR